MDRDLLSDAHWERIAPLLPGKEGDPGRSGEDNRLFVEGVLWLGAVARPAAALRQMGDGLEALSKMGREGRIRADLRSPVGQSRLRVRAHRRHHRQGPPARRRRKRGTQNQAIGKSRGGLTTKIVALVDALGNLARFVLLPGQRHDSIGVEPLLHGIALEALIGDKAFDSDWLRADLNERGALAVIPPNGSRAGNILYDKEMYKWRHLVENFFQKLKEIRCSATRYDKTDTSFRAAIYFVASFLALK
jgi:transposase